MTAGRRVAALLALLGALLGSVPGVARAAGGRYAADRVVVVGVPGLTWGDVGAGATPQLAALARDGAIGAVSVRAARRTTCVLDGWATLGAGNRAGFPGTHSCEEQERHAVLHPAEAVGRVDYDSGSRRYGSSAGALGRAVGCAAVAGSAAGVAVAAPGVRLTAVPTLPRDRPTLAALLTACPLTLVALDAGTSASAVDAAVGRLRAAVAALPGRTLLLVDGISEVGAGHPALHVGIAVGPGFGAGTWLVSPSTGRTPYAQLIDAAPTALRALGRTVPVSMNGRPMRSAGARPPLGTAIRGLRLAGIAAAVHYRRVAVFFWVLVAVGAALVLAGLLLLGGLPPFRRSDGAGGTALRILCLPAAALPVASYLAGLVPWEGAARPGWALAGAVVAADLVVAGLAVARPWRRRRFGPPLVVLAVTFATLVGDVATGSHLELDGLLGYDPIVAGRFIGVGNLSFALLSTTGLLLAAALASAAGRRAGRERAGRVAAGITLLVGALVVGVDGAPQLGSDFGGVLAAVPAFLLLALLLAGARVSAGRIAAILGAAVLTVGAVAGLDWLRPADQRTHLGRFVQQLLDGNAWTVVSRKGEANLGILTGSVLSVLLPVALVATVWLVRPGGLLRGRNGPHAGPLRAGLIAVAVDLGLGAAVNDSGVAVPAAAAAVLVPLLVRLAADPGTARPGEGDPCSGPAADPGRVTVGSRGSTAWNA